MESKNMTMMPWSRRLLPPRILVSLLIFTTLATGDVDKDREKCANDLVGLATCLPYVSGGSRSPPPDCCSALKTVLRTSPQCVCLLVKDKDDPSLGLKINATLAMLLPSRCQAPANISACPSLLHLAPNSPDARVFEDFSGGKGNDAANNTSAPVTAKSGNGETRRTTAGASSDGGKTKGLLGIEMVIGLSLLITMVLHYLPNL